MSHLGRFALSDMVLTSARLRRLSQGAISMEEVGRRIVDHLYDEFKDPETGERDCVLARFYKTIAFADLPAELQAFAAALLGDEDVRPHTPCLSLLASRGKEPEWNDRRRSVAHRCVPLASEEIVTRSPMVAQLILQFGLELSAVIEPDPELVLERDEKTYNVFYVPTAPGSHCIPAQADFVDRHGVASALGFGGILPSGDLYAVVLFSRVPIPAETAERFRPLALSMKVALLPFVDGPLFATSGAGDGETSVEPAGGSDGPPSRTSAIEQLLEVHEAIAAEQAGYLETALDVGRERARQLRGLSKASVVINSTLSPEKILDRVTDQARIIIGCHHARTGLTGLEVHRRGWGSEPGAGRHPAMREPLAVPLVSRDGETLGLIELSDKLDGTEFTEEDESMLVQLAHMASVTLENAQLFQREHEIAVALQNSLLPQQLPHFPGFEVASRYHGPDGADVGGDWYDVFPVGGGRVGLVLGDVAGRGITAASVMGQLRLAVRAYAPEGDRPGTVVERVDRLLQQLELVDMATLAYGVLHPDGCAMDLVLAGHPPPLIIAADGEVTFADAAASVPLGAVPGATYGETRIRLVSGSTMVLYSDGLVESRTLPLERGLERLRRVASQAPAALEDLCDHLISTLVGPDNSDDVTILAVRALPGGSAVSPGR